MAETVIYAVQEMANYTNGSRWEIVEVHLRRKDAWRDVRRRLEWSKPWVKPLTRRTIRTVSMLAKD